ncbi:MAG: enoyl-CoA hydratase-related protein, partial [Ilumatobacteraceae bacterium]
MSLVVVSHSEGVATLTLNNAAERNTLTAPMVAEIVEAMDEVESDQSVGAIVVTGAPPAFCAGANLGNLAEADEASLGAIYEGFLRIARSPLPTLAAVNGAAVGAGMNLALGCDIRLAARRAKFDTRFLQIGLHPGGGHTWMLRRIAGPQAAMAAVVFGEVIDGEEAARIGLAHRCVDDDQLLDAAQAMAARAAS